MSEEIAHYRREYPDCCIGVTTTSPPLLEHSLSQELQNLQTVVQTQVESVDLAIRSIRAEFDDGLSCVTKTSDSVGLYRLKHMREELRILKIEVGSLFQVI